MEALASETGDGDASSGVEVQTHLLTQENNNYKQRYETCIANEHSIASPTACVK